jgi:hypothetical protein
MRMSSRLTKVERRLVALRIAHADDLDIGRVLDIVHGLWRDEYELAPNRPSCSLYDHLHTAFAVDAVHEHVTVSVSMDLSER